MPRYVYLEVGSRENRRENFIRLSSEKEKETVGGREDGKIRGKTSRRAVEINARPARGITPMRSGFSSPAQRYRAITFDAQFN